jgi:hypothetical protein
VVLGAGIPSVARAIRAKNYMANACSAAPNAQEASQSEEVDDSHIHQFNDNYTCHIGMH